jgi:hypothetical protein
MYIAAMPPTAAIQSVSFDSELSRSSLFSNKEEKLMPWRSPLR